MCFLKEKNSITYIKAIAKFSILFEIKTYSHLYHSNERFFCKVHGKEHFTVTFRSKK